MTFPRQSQRQKWFEQYPALAIIFTSIISTLFFLLAGEIIIRWSCPNLNPIGESKHLYQARTYGDSYGLVPNTRGISFGTLVYTDANGFRVPRPSRYASTLPQPGIAFLGDSVAFGVGIKGESIFIEQLNQDLKNSHIFNLGVTGYALPDYKNVIAHFLLPRQQDFNFKYVLIGFCLNDLSLASQQRLTQVLARPTDQKLRYNNPFVRWLRSFNDNIFNFNDFLRVHSRLYLWLKAWMADTSQGYFLADTQIYTSPHLEPLLQEYEQLVRIMEQQGLKVLTILFPYEYQLREIKPAPAYPQSLLLHYFQKHQIACLDLYPDMRRYLQSKKIPSQALFLYHDPMHYSLLGHTLIYQILRQQLQPLGIEMQEKPSP